MRAFSSPGMRRDHGALDVLGQRGRDAVRIDRGVVEPLRLEENLVPVALAEAHDLVLDRRAIARPAARDLPGIHRRAMHVRPDDLVRRRRRAGDAAVDLRRFDPLASASRTARAARRPAASPAAAQSMVVPSSRGGVPVLSRPSAKPSRSSVSDSPTAGASPTRPAGDLLLADVDQAAQKGAGGEHHRAAAEARGRRRGARRVTAPSRDRPDRRPRPRSPQRFSVARIARCIAAA